MKPMKPIAKILIAALVAVAAAITGVGVARNDAPRQDSSAQETRRTDASPNESGRSESRRSDSPRSRDASPATSIAVAELPPEGRETLDLIKKGGPYPFARDGIAFGNREGILPKRQRGYYREFTVVTPGIKHRGARRIVSGQPGEYYYTDDHYRSFRKISE